MTEKLDEALKEITNILALPGRVHSERVAVALSVAQKALTAWNTRPDADCAPPAEPCRECAAVSAAIGGVEFMDPPDGGDVSLSEQVRRMREALNTRPSVDMEGVVEFIERNARRGRNGACIADVPSFADAILSLMGGGGTAAEQDAAMLSASQEG